MILFLQLDFVILCLFLLVICIALCDSCYFHQQYQGRNTFRFICSLKGGITRQHNRIFHVYCSKSLIITLCRKFLISIHFSSKEAISVYNLAIFPNTLSNKNLIIYMYYMQKFCSTRVQLFFSLSNYVQKNN